MDLKLRNSPLPALLGPFQPHLRSYGVSQTKISEICVLGVCPLYNCLPLHVPKSPWFSMFNREVTHIPHSPPFLLHFSTFCSYMLCPGEQHHQFTNTLSFSQELTHFFFIIFPLSQCHICSTILLPLPLFMLFHFIFFFVCGFFQSGVAQKSWCMWQMLGKAIQKNGWVCWFWTAE